MTQRSTNAVEDFLQTAVFVDDRAYYSSEERLNPPPGTLIEDPAIALGVGRIGTPSEIGGSTDRPEPESAANDGPQENTPDFGPKPSIDDELEHPLNVKRVTDAFATKGLICAVLCPSKGEDPAIATIPAARRADILVLDWHLLGTYGDVALSILRQVIESDVDHRLRVIAVYTGQRGLEQISQRVKEVVKTATEVSGRGFDTQSIGSFTCKAGPIVVSVFAKPGTRIAKGDPAMERIIAPENLPQVLIAEFTRMTGGLVSNVILKALATVRANTHELLAKVHPRLDSPFLSHRALLPSPDDAGDHLVALVADEISGLIDGGDAAQEADIDAIRAWIQERGLTNWSIPVNEPKLKSLSTEDVTSMLESGVDQWQGWEQISGNAAKRLKKDLHRQLTSLFCDIDEVPEELDFQFARLTSMSDFRTAYGAKPKRVPRLGLGTILENEFAPDGVVDRYSLSLQPRCDSARLNGPRHFPLLPLHEVEAPGRFQIVVVNTNGMNIRLQPVLKPFRVRMVEFVPDPVQRRVTGRSVDREFVFESTNGSVFRWLGTLKPAHAQRVANSYAATIARVGLNEAEWLRRAGGEQD